LKVISKRLKVCSTHANFKQFYEKKRNGQRVFEEDRANPIYL